MVATMLRHSSSSSTKAARMVVLLKNGGAYCYNGFMVTLLQFKCREFSINGGFWWFTKVQVLLEVEARCNDEMVVHVVMVSTAIVVLLVRRSRRCCGDGVTEVCCRHQWLNDGVLVVQCRDGGDD
ncbi:hypothetical protein DEO72_LG8g2033 [Vigna unguiculata]|uniref:Transmembrane protein n=1 Tax=Vigna unguiculata TaxID=3917 RepID=A0A4D6MTQ9_VIGUN|nr:hypothetical protein DEO72_LG8g2033 [Vigna unguiculata]